MELDQILKFAGLNEKQAKVYLACLELGESTVYHIAQKSGLKRPTVYLILEELNIQGLVSVIKKKKHIVYKPLNPKRLLDIIKGRERKIESIIPTLLTLYRDSHLSPAIQIYKGREGIEAVYNECFEYLDNEEELLIIGAIAQFANFPYLLGVWEKGIKQGKGKYKVRELNNYDDFAKKYEQKMKKYVNKNYQTCLLSEKYNFINCDFFLYRNKVVIFSHVPDLFAIMIESKNIFDSFRKLFELAWRFGKNKIKD